MAGKEDVFYDSEDNKFYLKTGDVTLAYIDVSFKNETCYFDYVFVNPDFRGQGLGQIIVSGALENLNKKNIQVIPICGYAKSIMAKMNNST